MASHIELLYYATSVEQLEKAIKLNPDINCIHGIYHTNALRVLLTSGYYKGEPAYPYTPLRIDSADELYQMVEMHLKAGADTEYCIDVVLWTSHSFEVKKRLITLLMDYGAKTKSPRSLLEHYDKDLLTYIFEGYYMDKLKLSYNATMIQNWFLRKYYSPYHPYGKARLEREFSKIERELSRNN
jgi:hypothetical protein